MNTSRWIAVLTVVLAAGALGVWTGRRSLGPAPRGSEPVQLWTCSMHPQVLQDKPGACPICGMQLTPVKKGSAGDRGSGSEFQGGPVVTLDSMMTQNLGIRVAEVEEGPLALSFRTVGYLREAEPRVYDVSLKIGGWIERLHAHTEGMEVRKGDPLFDLYSPDLRVAQEELRLARRALDRLPPGADGGLKADAERLAEGARQKLEVWDVPAEAIEETARPDPSTGIVTFRSPVDGFVSGKVVSRGSAVEAGKTLLRIVDLSELWIDARIYETRIPLVRAGQSAVATVRGFPGIEGKVVFLSPLVDDRTRSVIARVAVPNPELHLKPGMFASVDIAVGSPAPRLTVPREAVIDTGLRRIAFVALEGGRFEPRRVRTGVETEDGRLEILSGLARGERVVVSGQFLLDSESRMREAIRKLSTDGLLQPPPDPRHAHSKAPSDGVVASYLEMVRELSQDRSLDAAGIDAFVEAAAPHEPVAAAAASLRGATLDRQREAFKKLSAAVIGLARSRPPTRAVAEKLFVLHCPMAEASWLQETGTPRNPYWGSEMLECGDVVETIETVRP